MKFFIFLCFCFSAMAIYLSRKAINLLKKHIKEHNEGDF